VDKYGIVEISTIPDAPLNIAPSGNALGVKNSTFKITNMIEKPCLSDAPTNLAIIGRYILTPEIFDVLENTVADKNGEIQITDALMTLAKQGKVIAYKFEGKRFDCGSVNGFVSATNYFFNKNNMN